MGQKRKKVLVCGGRDFSDCTLLMRTLDQVKPDIIVHGGARGADSMAGGYAKRRAIPCQVFPAEWNKHGKRAGYLRNQQMLDEGKPDLVVAFPGGPGTRMMVKIAREQGFAVQVMKG